MQLSKIDRKVIKILHSLPNDDQQSLLNFGLFLKQNKVTNKPKENSQNFAEFLQEFRQKIESEQIDIDTSIFDKDRHSYIEREILL